MNDTLKIKGIAYKIINVSEIPYKNLGRLSITLQRMKGKVLYNVIKYENNTYSEVTSMGALMRIH